MLVKKKVRNENFDSINKNFYFIRDFKRIYGIGKNRLIFFYNLFGLNKRLQFNKVSYIIFLSINKLVDKFTYKNTLKSVLVKIRKFTVEKLKNYKGARHLLRYPVRGQRTHTNAKTRKKLRQGVILDLT